MKKMTIAEELNFTLLNLEQQREWLVSGRCNKQLYDNQFNKYIDQITKGLYKINELITEDLSVEMMNKSIFDDQYMRFIHFFDLEILNKPIIGIETFNTLISKYNLIDKKNVLTFLKDCRETFKVYKKITDQDKIKHDQIKERYREVYPIYINLWIRFLFIYGPSRYDKKYGFIVGTPELTTVIDTVNKMLLNISMIFSMMKSQNYGKKHQRIVDKTNFFIFDYNVLGMNQYSSEINDVYKEIYNFNGRFLFDQTFDNFYKTIFLKYHEKFFKNIDKLTFEKDVFLSGNSIYSVFSGKHPKDYDLFFRNEWTIMNALNCLRDLYPDSLKGLSCNSDNRLKYIKTKHGIELIFDDKNKTKITNSITINSNTYIFLITNNAVTITEMYNDAITDPPFQLILKKIGKPKEVVKTFDHEHCKAFIDFKTKKVNMNYLTKLCITEHLAIVTNKKTDLYNPLSVLIRHIKFIKLGMKSKGYSVMALGKSLMEYKEDPQKLMRDVSFYGKSEIEEFFEKPNITYEDLLKKLYTIEIKEFINTQTIGDITKPEDKPLNLFF